MSKKWRLQRQQSQRPEFAPIGPDAPTVGEIASDDGPDGPEDTDVIAAGQVWEDVVVPDRSVNVLGLRPGSKLPPIQIDGPFHDATGHWAAGFVGERGTKIRVDEEMLRRGRRTA